MEWNDWISLGVPPYGGAWHRFLPGCDLAHTADGLHLCR